jgi:16S rRNA (guanine966-N2)-methyltransferase
MRVISGEYKGRILTTKKDLSVRPATDRVKQTLFDMLMTRMEFDGARVLDLFAGSGSLGIEALSRGAAHATFVEEDDGAADSIERNIRMLGCEQRASLMTMDAVGFIERCMEQFDLIFADPPYAYDATAQIPAMIFANNLLAASGYLLIEHSKESKFESTDAYSAGPEKQFGRTRVTFFRNKT